MKRPACRKEGVDQGNGSSALDTNPNLFGLPFGGPNGSRDLGLLTIQKTGSGSNTRYSVHASQPRRDPAFASVASDIIRSQAIFKCVPVHFRQEVGPTVTGLASFPGSGNTWVRYLLQLSTEIAVALSTLFKSASSKLHTLECRIFQFIPPWRHEFFDANLDEVNSGISLEVPLHSAGVVVPPRRRTTNEWVGIFTGSVYKDFALLRNGFPGESITNGRVLVVKTHESGPMARAQFQKAILLVRKPAEAILAEFNRRAAGHIGHADWSSFVAQKGKSWTETNLDWIEGFQGPLLISMYHQLVQNTTQELTTILDFLGEPVTESVMNCVINNKEGIYRRRKKNVQFNPFTSKMEKFLSIQERIVYNAIQRRMRKEGTTTTLGPSGLLLFKNTAVVKNNHHDLDSYLSYTNSNNNNESSSQKGEIISQ
ncbi:WSC domain-containing protein 2 [Folsomia candida]|uniref:WSC domain-containing protein 2 n=1 Tax=Folsomia candida TaxID=158441 RepID=A0A226E723_FOLCA|nr:WSC domain-containing protein 2 [Folsomia candida]